MKEIGGYFELETLMENEFYDDLIALNNGRNALLYLLKAKNITKLYIPFYLCHTVSDILEKHGYPYEYYEIDAEFMPIFSKSLGDGEFLYIVNLFGQLDDGKISSLKERHHQVILDYTHSFFQRPVGGVDTIYSCRKYFGVPDGAYLATDTLLEEELEVDESKERMSHLLGRFEGTASDFYGDFIKNNMVFDSEPLKAMSKLSRNLLGAIDYEKARLIRNENFQFLAEHLSGVNNLALVAPDGAFSYPLYLEGGMDIRKKLSQKKIYIPLLWPNVLENVEQASLEYQYAANILPLPCDQRYNTEDMQHIINTLQTVLNKEL